MSLTEKRKLRGIVISMRPYLEKHLLDAQFDCERGLISTENFYGVNSRYRMMSIYLAKWITYSIGESLSVIAPLMIDLNGIAEMNPLDEKIKKTIKTLSGYFDRNGFKGRITTFNIPVKLH